MAAGTMKETSREPKREKHIPLQMGRLDTSFGELSKAVDELADSLSPVLRGSSLVCEESDAEGDSDCGLANDIAGFRRRVERLVGSVRELRDRLEV